MTAQVTKHGALSLQVCVPRDWTDEQIKAFADSDTPCGTEAGWGIRREGDEMLKGAAERVPCQAISDHVHVMLDA